jgi:hypothetical protein
MSSSNLTSSHFVLQGLRKYVRHLIWNSLPCMVVDLALWSLPWLLITNYLHLSIVFIAEITGRAFIVADSNKRRTLSRADIAKALTKSDHFDFLIDIVPREEAALSGQPAPTGAGGSGVNGAGGAGMIIRKGGSSGKHDTVCNAYFYTSSNSFILSRFPLLFITNILVDLFNETNV